MRRRHAALGEHPYERLAAIGILEDASEIGQRCALGIADVNRRQDAAVHRHQMRREADLDRPSGGCREPLVDLGHMAVVRYAVSSDAFRYFGEEAGLLEAAPGAGDAGLGVDD